MGPVSGCEHAGVTDQRDGALPVDPDVGDGRLGGPAVVAAVAAGGALGAPARYAVAEVVSIGDGFPWATFWTNVSGSLLLGFLLMLVVHRFPPSRFLRPFVATGFLGAFTTFSTFVVEADLLVRDGHPATAAVYVTASLVVGLAAVWAGVVGGRRAVGVVRP